MITFFTDDAPVAGAPCVLDSSAAHHARVRRIAVGTTVRATDGRGLVGEGVIASLTRAQLTVEIAAVTQVLPPVPLDVLVPVADRERMLWAAEKCAELQVTAWRPVRFARSSSVATRGEGDRFHAKVRARMQSALEQSGGAWLPAVHPEADVETALAAIPEAYDRIVLDREGSSMLSGQRAGPTAILSGPEGGMEARELEHALSAGWRRAALAGTTLRFETAVIAAAALIRAQQLT